METLVSPSLLSADFLHLYKDIEMINNSEADYIHMDIMDGVFVPNISFGFPILKAVGKACKKPMDVHYMIVHPENYIQQTADAGAAIMSVHYETCPHLHRTIQQIKQTGMKAGVVINPATPVSVLEDIIVEVDLVLIMSVNPGFGGQVFIENAIKKVERLRKLINETGSNAIIEVDGGVDNNTIAACAKAGANVFVAGSYLFKNPDLTAQVQTLRDAIDA